MAHILYVQIVMAVVRLGRCIDSPEPSLLAYVVSNPFIRAVLMNIFDYKVKQYYLALTICTVSFQFTSGVISKDAIADLDFILATPDNVTALMTLRSTLRERLPKLGNDTLHADLRFLLDKYTKGVLYDITKPSEQTGKAQIPIGKVFEP